MLDREPRPFLQVGVKVIDLLPHTGGRSTECYWSCIATAIFVPLVIRGRDFHMAHPHGKNSRTLKTRGASVRSGYLDHRTQFRILTLAVVKDKGKAIMTALPTPLIPSVIQRFRKFNHLLATSNRSRATPFTHRNPSHGFHIHVLE